MWKTNYLADKKGVISELVYQLKHQNKIINFPNDLLITHDYSSNYQWYSGDTIYSLCFEKQVQKT